MPTPPTELQQAHRDFDAGLFHVAEVACRKCLAADPQCAGGWALLGLLAHKAGDLKSAMGLFQHAVELEPALAIAHNNLGVLYGKKGDVQKALAHFDQAIAVDPNDRAAHINRAHLLSQRAEIAASASMPATAIHASQSPKISLTMIVRNEERNLRDCLDCVTGLVDEVVIVDTGCTDGTVAIAQSMGARVVSFPWIDSFAAARNAALQQANGEWIFWLDADDRLDAANREKLRDLFSNLPATNVAYAMTCRCPGRDRSDTLVDHVRLFRNLPEVRWEYRVHEQIFPCIARRGGNAIRTDIVIDHVGYRDESLERQKLERNLRLLELDLNDSRHDPFLLYNLGHTLFGLQRPVEGIAFVREGLSHTKPGDPTRRPLGALLARSHRTLGQNAEAVSVCQAMRNEFPRDAELLYEECQARRQQGDQAGAEACLREMLTSRPQAKHFSSVPAGLRGHLAHHNLAVLCWEQKRYAEAESHWKQALADRPDDLVSWRGLGMLYLRLERWDDVERVARGMEGLPGGSENARQLLAQASFTKSKNG